MLTRRVYVAVNRSEKDQLAEDMTRGITDLSAAPRTSDSTSAISTASENAAIATELEERSSTGPVSSLGSVLSLWSLLNQTKRRSTTPEKT